MCAISVFGQQIPDEVLEGAEAQRVAFSLSELDVFGIAVGRVLHSALSAMGISFATALCKGDKPTLDDGADVARQVSLQLFTLEEQRQECQRNSIISAVAKVSDTVSAERLTLLIGFVGDVRPWSPQMAHCLEHVSNLFGHVACVLISCLNAFLFFNCFRHLKTI